MGLRWLVLGLEYSLSGSDAMQVWRSYERRQWDSPAAFGRYCEASLEAALERAAAVPYHQRLGCGRDISSYPLLSRAQLLDHYEELKSPASQEKGSYVSMSSGSSGRQVSVLCDPLERSARAAVTWRGDAFPGQPGEKLDPGCSTVALWGFSSLALDRQSLRRRVATWAQNKVYFDCLVMTPEKARHVHSELRRLRPERITGYVHALALFSRMCQELGLPRISAKKLIPSAEWLDPVSRELIEGIFDAPIRERYGSREVGDIAHQCEHGTWHINADHLLLEVERPDGSIAREGQGNLLITKLNNRVMPLVRYRIEDVGTLGGPPCACGRALPVMQELSGRISSHFNLPDGNLLSQFAATIPLHHIPVREWQVIQEDKTHVRYLLVPTEEYKPEMAETIRSKFVPYHSGQFEVDVELVDEIPLAPSGKRILVRNRLLEG